MKCALDTCTNEFELNRVNRRGRRRKFCSRRCAQRSAKIAELARRREAPRPKRSGTPAVFHRVNGVVVRVAAP